MKILAVGENAKEFAKDIFPDADIHTSSKNKEDFDSVLSYMCLQTVHYPHAFQTVKGWADCLKQGGELTLMVPSLEWAAVQILSKERSPVLMTHLFGNDNKSGYTMIDLRAMCSMADIAVTHAATGEYTINESVCEMHTVRGIKK
jgi:hypothetical protein